jgi:hypothetical protein
MLKTDSAMAPTPFVPNGGVENALTFMLRPLTGEQMVEICEYAYLAGDDLVNLKPRGIMLAARYAVAGWLNWIDSNGRPVEYSAAAVGNIPYEFLKSIAKEVLERNSLDEKTRKNS